MPPGRKAAAKPAAGRTAAQTGQQPAVPPGQAVIHVEGARVHNLRNLTLDIPRNRLVTVTGPSGSGKSSLVFDTLHAEGQRRYLERLSSGSRQFAGRLPRPDVDLISGLPPTISVPQHPGSVGRRSTLATLTEVHDYLRLLFSRAGQAFCPQCSTPVSRRSPQQIVDRLLELPERRKLMILAPLVRGRRGGFRQVFEQITRDGFVRARVDGETIDAADPPELDRQQPHFIEVVIDRIVIREGIRPRLQDSVHLALAHGQGSCLVCQQTDEGWTDTLFSERFACTTCDLNFAELEPRDFSFNSPWGACPECQGLGTIAEGDAEHGAPLPTATPPVCPTCHGARLRPFASCVRFEGRTLGELLALTVGEAAMFFSRATTGDHDESPAPHDNPAAAVRAHVLPGIVSRLRFLEQAGLAYLQLDRPARSLSGGEFQRARLATCLGNGLTGVCYLLDEPTAGLHSRDTRRLLDTLDALQRAGNSLVIVEHDREVMQASDWLIDIGPGAGEQGGTIVAAGTVEEVARRTDSATGRFLAAAQPNRWFRGREAAGRRMLRLRGAALHNLRQVDLDVAAGCLTAITGVSGSGKSTLIRHCLLPLLREQLENADATPIPDDPRGRLDDDAGIARLLEVDQSPLGRGGRSCPATHAKLWPAIRRLFSRTKEARIRGWSARRFSFNAAEGRCPTCRGRGQVQTGMNLLPDLETPCPECDGSRFNRQTLDVRYRGKNVADVLSMPFAEAAEFFRHVPVVGETCRVFGEVGLGYLRLGQPAVTLSGGEAQRIRLATRLARARGEHSLIVLDEPTSGLHAVDIDRLLALLQQLVDDGHTLLVIEHQLDVIAAADHVIDLGPDGGSAGGLVVAEGTPAVIAAEPASFTGQALRRSGLVEVDLERD